MYQRSRRKLVVPFLMPAFIVYTLLMFVPIILTVAYSLTGWQGHIPDRPFTGITNYVLLFKDPQFLNSIKNTAIFSFSGAIILFIPAIFISWALTQKIRFKATYRYVIIAPLVLSSVVIALLWKMLYDPQFGPINHLLKAIGLGSLALPWLGDTRTVLLAIVIATCWYQLGMWVLLISAGVERIPIEIQEAAKVDGANEWQVFWRVTFPMLWGILRLLFILWIIHSLQVFAQVYIMAPAGGPGGAADVMVTLIYERAFSSDQWGLACAMATFLLFVILGLSLITNRLTERETVEF